MRALPAGFRQIHSGLAHRLQQVRSVIRLKPFDTTTPEGMSRERYRRIALTTITSIAAKGIALLTTLISIPLTVNYLGTERFGLWMTISSMIAALIFADFGIGNGLLNAISEAHGKNDEDLARKYVSSGFIVLAATGGAVLLVFALMYPFIPWGTVFNVSSEQAARESGPALAVFVTCFVASLVLGIVQRVQLGYQEGFITNLWQILGSLLGLAGVLIGIHSRASLPWLVAAVAGLPVLAIAINWVQFFVVKRPWLHPRLSGADWHTGRHLVSVGFVFMLLNVLAQNWSQTDNLIIAQVLGAEAVSGYAVVQKIFSVVMLAQFFVIPLWPAYGEALARSDFGWARRTLNRALGYSVLLTASLSLPFLFFGRSIVSIWTGIDYAPTFSLMLGFSILSVLFIVAWNLSSLLVHGANLRGQLFFYAAASIVALLLKAIFAVWFGTTGVVWGTVLGFGLIYTPLALRLAYRTLHRS